MNNYVSAFSAGAVPGAHAVNMLHYTVPPPLPPTNPFIRGVGECAWCVPNGLEQYSSLALAGRLANVAYYAGWDWINYWPNFLTGMNASRHAWHQVRSNDDESCEIISFICCFAPLLWHIQPGCNGTDRTDGIDGWNSPVMDWVQRAFHPFLVADLRSYASNPIFRWVRLNSVFLVRIIMCS